MLCCRFCAALWRGAVRRRGIWWMQAARAAARLASVMMDSTLPVGTTALAGLMDSKIPPKLVTAPDVGGGLDGLNLTACVVCVGGLRSLRQISGRYY